MFRTNGSLEWHYSLDLPALSALMDVSLIDVAEQSVRWLAAFKSLLNCSQAGWVVSEFMPLRFDLTGKGEELSRPQAVPQGGCHQRGACVRSEPALLQESYPLGSIRERLSLDLASGYTETSSDCPDLIGGDASSQGLREDFHRALVPAHSRAAGASAPQFLLESAGRFHLVAQGGQHLFKSGRGHSFGKSFSDFVQQGFGWKAACTRLLDHLGEPVDFLCGAALRGSHCRNLLEILICHSADGFPDEAQSDQDAN